MRYPLPVSDTSYTLPVARISPSGVLASDSSVLCLQVNLQVVAGELPDSYTGVTYNIIPPPLVCEGSCLGQLFLLT
jgi:hypothetical protein